MLNDLPQKGVRATATKKTHDIPPCEFKKIRKAIVRIAEKIVRNFVSWPIVGRAENQMSVWPQYTPHFF